ncbi:RHS repeat-associated core domain-containing protein [Sorangium sp. So ce426]|uniref:RHS repeat-associated core domain-containing protein n=1 Tax=unclassified Sorangium TaxID=2621164 RepID=UPI003F5C0ABB
MSARSQGSRTWTYTYEDNGWLTTATDPLLNTVSLLHDAVGRSTQVTRADDEVIGTSYYPGGLVHTVTPPDRPAHTFGYTPADLLEEYLAPAVGGAPGDTSWSYDLDGMLTSSARPGEAATVYTRDPSTGRLSQVALPLGMGTISYAYHPSTGRLTTIASPSGISLNFAYDGMLLTSLTWTGAGFGGNSSSVQWVYDNDFRIDTETVGSGATINFDYDADGLLTQAGGLTLSRHPNNGTYTGSTIGVVSDTISRDAYGAVATYVAQASGSTLYEVTSTPDALGRIQSMTETIQGQTATYEYVRDLAGRLTDVYRDGVIAAHYDYNANGNRLSRTSSAGTESGTYDDQDRLLSYALKTYGVSSAGDLTSITDTVTGATTTLTYDARGNLRQAVLGTGDVIDYLVDGGDRRIWKKKNGAVVQGFIYRDDLRPVAELNAAGAVVAQFVYGQGRNVPDLILKGAATYRILTDHRNSPRLVVNIATGAIAQRLDYDEFGRLLQDTNPGFQPFGFAGGLYDADTKLVRFGARDYDAEVGRWTAKDPIRFDGGDTNLYGYVLNDPISFTDPNGLGPVGLLDCLLSGRSLADCWGEEKAKFGSNSGSDSEPGSDSGPGSHPGERPKPKNGFGMCPANPYRDPPEPDWKKKMKSCSGTSGSARVKCCADVCDARDIGAVASGLCFAQCLVQ